MKPREEEKRREREGILPGRVIWGKTRERGDRFCPAGWGEKKEGEAEKERGAEERRGGERAKQGWRITMEAKGPRENSVLGAGGKRDRGDE